ncbi:MAG TPA: aromatic ring-hydroxylating dioxygenase subunit alpha [Ktedonobacterales bacterium]
MVGDSYVGGEAAAIREGLAAGHTLPAAWYTDPAMYRRERERIFHHTWQYAGLAEHLANAGDFFTCQLGDVPIVVLRDTDGDVRAYINVCRHRGSQLVLDACGTRKTLQCHYHAWTYNLDGSLRAAPGEKGEPGFDRGEFGLLAAQVALWGPFVFVNPDLQAPPLATMLGTLPQLVDATGLNLGAIKRRVRREYDIAANWKVVLDNYLECYHCPVAHQSFSDLIDVNDYTVTEYDYFSTQGGPMKRDARGAGRPYDVTGEVADGFYAYLWPNFTLNIYPGPGNVSLNLFLPMNERRTLAIYEYCFVDAVTDSQVDDFARFIDQVQEEDIVLCESVQRGLESGFFQRGTLMLSREKGLQHFQRLVHAAVTDDR